MDLRLRRHRRRNGGGLTLTPGRRAARAGLRIYQGGHTCHTGQFSFAEDLVTKFHHLQPYAATTTRVLLTEDFLYDGTGSTGGLLTLRYDPRHIQRGVHATLTMSVDPSATYDGEGGFPGGGIPSATPTPSA